jgi:hypothetical protein
LDTLSSEDREHFWKGVHDKAAHQVKEYVQHTLTKHVTSGDAVRRRGTFEPLGFYEKLGYDCAKIKAMTPPEDQMMDPILGQLYRVHRISSEEFSSRGQTQQDRTMKHMKPLRIRGEKRSFAAAVDDAAGDAADGDVPPEVLDDGGSGDSDHSEKADEGKNNKKKKSAPSSSTSKSSSGSSSSSSSDSSSSEKKHKKKKTAKRSKKSKKTRKAKKKAAADKAKTKQKMQDEKRAADEKKKIEKTECQAVAKAQSLLAKIATQSGRLSECIGNPSFSHVPEPIAKPIKDALHHLQGFSERATIVISAKGKTLISIPEPKDVDTLSSDRRPCRFQAQGNSIVDTLIRKAALPLPDESLTPHTRFASQVHLINAAMPLPCWNVNSPAQKTSVQQLMPHTRNNAAMPLLRGTAAST